jgi:O-antigen/teichoic acid export membrane protein
VGAYQTVPEPSVQPAFAESSSADRSSEARVFRRIVHNGLALSLSRPFTWLSATALTILLPRYLGDVNLGKINAAFAFADWCGLLVSLGIGTYLTKEVARRGAEVGSLILNAALLRLALAVAVTLVAIVLAGVITDDSTTRQLIYLLSVHMVLMVIGAVLTGGLQGMQQLRAVAVVDAASKLSLVGFVCLFLLGGLGASEVAIAYILSDLLSIAGLVWTLSRAAGLSGPINLDTWSGLIKGGLPFLMWEASLLTYARIDVVILAFFATNSVLGWYYAAYRIMSIPLFLPSILMTVTFPALSASVSHRETFNVISRRGVQATVFISVPMALGLMLLSGKLIDLFGYAASFHNAVVPLALLSAGLPLVAANMIIAPALAALDRQRQWALAGVGAAVLNPLVNLVAVPYTQSEFGNGGIGAAATTTLTEVYLLGMALWLLPSGVLHRSTLTNCAKSVVAGLVMGAALLVAMPLSLFVLVPLGACVYAGASLGLGNLPIADLRSLRDHLLPGRAPAPPPETA